MRQNFPADDTLSPEGYSSTVELYLHVDGERYELADVGPVDATLRNPAILPVGNDRALLEIIVDGHVERYQKNVSASDARNRVQFLSDTTPLKIH